MSRKLVLHLDINQTVSAYDGYLKVGPEEAINLLIAGAVWGQERGHLNPNFSGRNCDKYLKHTPGDKIWEWNSFQPSLEAPNTLSVSYFKYLEARTLESNPFDHPNLRETLGQFTATHHGQPFRPLFNTLRNQLLWNYPPNIYQSKDTDSNFVATDSNGVKFHFLLPSFINMLYALKHQGRDFSVIFRTFGEDSRRVLQCVERVVLGQHPGFPNTLSLNVDTTPGLIRRFDPNSPKGMGLQVNFPPEASQTDTNGVRITERQKFICASLEDATTLYKAFSSIKGVCAFEDDYAYWRQNGYSPSAGKPFFLDTRDTSSHHIFFDDNAKVDSYDNILDIRFLTEDHDNNEIKQSSEAFVVRANLLESIQNKNYFLDQIQSCEQAYRRLLNEIP